MASIGHAIVDLAAARFVEPRDSRRRRIAHTFAWIAVSNFGDLDVVAFKLDIPYYATWGHRGASHSIAFATVLGVVWGLLLARDGRLDPWRTCLVGVLVAVSHLVLDAMTDGGLGVAIARPISDRRYFLPWRPLPVAPIGLSSVSFASIERLLVELM
jgi:inner membrane protein